MEFAGQPTDSTSNTVVLAGFADRRMAVRRRKKSQGLVIP